MPLQIGWPEIALRLGLAFIAALLVGFNRGKRGEAAGLRTTLLVVMAAAVSMIQVNLLLATDGKTPSSFSVLDLMRLPLGILTGMGFIGAGAVLKRGNMVLGVTTAATLWFSTVMGLCFGGGQIGLGAVSLVLTLFILTALKWVEQRFPREHRGLLSVTTIAKAMNQQVIEAVIRKSHAQPLACSLRSRQHEPGRKYEFVVSWRSPLDTSVLPGFVEHLAQEPSLREVTWIPDSVSSAYTEKTAAE